MKSRRSLAILFAIVFVDLVGFGMVIPVMPLYAERLGASNAWTGLLSTGYSLMQFIFAPIWGRWSDRIGRRPVLLGSIAMTAVAFAMYGMASSFTWLLVSRLFAGAATANIAIAQAYVADVTPPEGRARGMGLIGAAFGLGFVLGPAIGGLLSQHSLGLPGFAAAGLSALNLVAAWFILPEPEHLAKAIRRPRFEAMRAELARPGIRRLLLCYFLVILAFSGMEATYAFLARHRVGLTERGVSYAFTYIGVLLVIVQGGLVGPLTRKFGEKRLLVAGIALQAVALAMLPFVGNLPGLLIATAPLAVGSGLSNPAISALISRQSRAEDQGGTLGIGQSAAACGRILGPESGTFTYDRHSPAAAYLIGATLMVLAAIVGSTVRGKEPNPAVEGG
ncbi:MAG TPA: MFS transporter [Anaeromyxobacteraceae bacterium]|nr:MFS transporter [Anaeromyxobacteraceae bacterium]